MNSALPREIRDMIWAELWPTDAIHGFSHLEELIYTRCPGQPCQCLRGVDMPPTLDPLVVGKQGAAESACALFRQIPWTCELDRADDIKQMLCHDAFHVGFIPLHGTRRLTVRFSLDRCARKEFIQPVQDKIVPPAVHDLGETDEPTRIYRWLTACFHLCDEVEGNLVPDELWSAYRDLFPRSGLNSHEFLRCVEAYFPETSQMAEHDAGSMPRPRRGFRYRTIPVQGTRRSWIDDVLRENLECLRGIPDKRGFRLEIEMVQRRLSLAVLGRVLDVVRPVVDEFKREGAHVRARYSYTSDAVERRYRHVFDATRPGAVCKPGSFSRDLEHIMSSLPAETWRRDLMQALEADDTIPAKHRVYRHEEMNVKNNAMDTICMHYPDEDNIGDTDSEDSEPDTDDCAPEDSEDSSSSEDEDDDDDV